MKISTKYNISQKVYFLMPKSNILTDVIVKCGIIENIKVSVNENENIIINYCVNCTLNLYESSKFDIYEQNIFSDIKEINKFFEENMRYALEEFTKNEGKPNDDDLPF